MSKKNNKSAKSESFETKETKEEADSNLPEAVHLDEPATDALNPLNLCLSDFPIVGIGASAGGLAAFEAFFSGMPVDRDPGMAFVLVQHLDPDHKSILTELIKRYTRMQVFEVIDGLTVEPNCVYVIPPNHDMALMNGKLHLFQPSAPRGQRFPIDFFFKSLAQDQHEKAICIVLSGTGSDGTEGAHAVKNEDGMILVQKPENGEFDGMPRSVISTGLADFILLPVEMAAHLIAYNALAFKKTPGSLSSPDAQTDESLEKIFILIRAHTGHDFSLYKKNTVYRRLERRMAAHQLANVTDYIRYLQHNPLEIEELFQSVLIGVTNFFRDSEAFAVLESKIIPGLFVDKPAGATIRVWIPACSTGEEAYSFAILLQERAEVLKKGYKINVFATDIDPHSIAFARAGVYPVGIATNIKPGRLLRFFSLLPDGKSYRIHKVLRDLLIFSEQNVIKDPPFSKLDLISCRNMMIYMGKELQQLIISLFYYSLNSGGILFLGTSETIGNSMDIFLCLDQKYKIYRRNDDAHKTFSLDFKKFPLSISESLVMSPQSGKKNRDRLNVQNLTEQVFLEQYTPVGILVNDLGQILYIHGRSGRFLEPPHGEADLNILNMAREGLQRDLGILLHQAMTDKKKVSRTGLRVKTNGDYSYINLTIQPIQQDTTNVTLYLVILEDMPLSDQPTPENGVTNQGQNDLVKEDATIMVLKQELQTKEKYLQDANEELEASNEELKSSNEEMLSINEELQSTSEEMETSREELQSVNEELAIVNNELQIKVSDLSRANNDMNNLLAATDIGTIFLDDKLSIQRFTPAISKIINLIASDVGRPVGDIVSNLANYTTLSEDIRSVLDSMVPKEIEVQTKPGAWFLLRIRPYRTFDNVIEGTTVTFVDINETKRLQFEKEKALAELQEATKMARLAVVVRDAHDAIMVHDLNGRIIVYNPQAKKAYGWSEVEALTMFIRDLTPPELQNESINRIKQLCNSEILKSYHTQRRKKNGQNVEVWLTATALRNEENIIYAIATTERLFDKKTENRKPKKKST